MKIEVTQDNLEDSLIYTFEVWSVRMTSYTTWIETRGILKEKLEDQPTGKIT